VIRSPAARQQAPRNRARRAKRRSRRQVTKLAGPGWTRPPACRANSAREQPGTVPPFVEPGPGPGAKRRGAGPSHGRGGVCPRGDADAGRPIGPDREGHVLQGACLGWVGGVSAETPTGGAGVSARNRVDRAEKQVMGRDRSLQRCWRIDEKALHRRDLTEGRRHAARARPTVPRT
jgi:hypothetical protein